MFWGYVISFSIGVFVANLGYGVSTWQWWAIIVPTAVVLAYYANREET